MTDSLPDRLSVDAQSPHYDEELLKRPIGVRFNGRERRDVEEYCVSEGWVRVAAGRALDRRGRPLTHKLKGEVVPHFLDEESVEGEVPAATPSTPESSREHAKDPSGPSPSD